MSKRKLKKGEMVPLIMDTAGKIFFGYPNIEITTLLVSSLLDIHYDELIGKISYLPLTHPKRIIKGKTIISDLVLLVETENETIKLIIEFNYLKSDLINAENDNKRSKRILGATIHEKLDKNLAYLCKAFVGIKEKENYSKSAPATLVNFNSFGRDNKERFNYNLLNPEDTTDLYSEKLKIRCINVAKCYREWYNGKYQRRSTNEHNLFILSAMMATKKIKEVEKLINELETSSYLKKKMLEVIHTMLIEDPSIDLYYDYHDELRKLRESVVQTCKQEFAKENFEKGEKLGERRGEKRGLKLGEANKEKEMVINSYKKGITLETISEICNSSLNKVKKIIEDYKKSLK